MTVEGTVRTFRREQRQAVAAAVAAVLGRWRAIDPERIVDSWHALLPQVANDLTAAQLAAARSGAAYVPQLVAAQGLTSQAAGTVNAAAFAGVASDGRPLETLFELPARQTLGRIGSGMAPGHALAVGRRRVGMLAVTMVADAGRLATSVGLTADRAVGGYRRQISPPACARCAILAGKWFRWNQGFQRHPACFPAGVVVSGPETLAASRRWFEGELVTITTASGHELLATANHPVLTDRGWVSAKLLQEGDHVVRSIGSEGARPLVVPDVQQMPSRIEDVLVSGGVPLLPMPTASEDFHGDGGHGEVDVVAAAESLLAHPGTVGRDKLIDGQRHVAPRWDAAPLALTHDDVARNSDRGRDLLDRLAGQVELDRVVKLVGRSWSGYVYNLTSSEGWYTANSLVVSNCQCVHVPATGPKSDVAGLETFDPDTYFNSLDGTQQDRLFTRDGAQAIRDGADINQVVNARRGMRTAFDPRYGRRVSTTLEGSTVRGRRRTAARPMPEEIYRAADGDREVAIGALARWGYLNG